MDEICSGCGQLTGIKEYDEKLWELYYRIDDNRSHAEPLVFTSDWLQENIHDDDDHRAMMLAMEKDMYYRGLCIKCGRPNLSSVDPSHILSEEDAQTRAEIHAEQQAERRMGA